MDTAGLRLTHCACRGMSAPWMYRGALKYRSVEARLFSASGHMPTGVDNRDFEIAYSEFTDSEDGASDALAALGPGGIDRGAEVGTSIVSPRRCS